MTTRLACILDLPNTLTAAVYEATARDTWAEPATLMTVPDARKAVNRCAQLLAFPLWFNPNTLLSQTAPSRLLREG